MSNVPEGAQVSDDGNYWWDGNQWQPVDQSQGQYSSAQPPDQSQASGAQINPEEFPSIARVLYFGADVDGYLQDLGIDTSDLQSDDPPVVA